MTYQPRLYKGKAIATGRNCDERWELIKKHVPKEGVMFDLGSSAGFFIISSVLENPDLFGISLEANDYECRVQRQVIKSHSCERICLINGMMSGKRASRWCTSGDFLDLTLILSVIHWFDDPAGVLRSLASMSKKLIVEIPDKDDSGACGQDFIKRMEDPLAWCREVTGFSAETIGRMTRHTSTAKSHLILITNHNSQPKDVTGVDLLNLMSSGRLLWPDTGQLLAKCHKAGKAQRKALDPLHGGINVSGKGLSLTASQNAGLRWQVGGSTKVIAEEEQMRIDAVNLHFELKLLRRLLLAWENNETADPDAAVNRQFLHEYLIHGFFQGMRNFIRAVMPAGLHARLKRLLK